MELDRRRFLGTAGLAAAGGVFGDTAFASEGDPAGEPLRELREVRSSDGLLDYSLTIAAHTFEVGGRRVHLDAYNGMLPGPLLRYRPGDRLRLKLTNLMRPMGVPLNALPPVCASKPPEEHGQPPEAEQDVLRCLPSMVGHLASGETLPQMLTTTNLHTHGLQVSPKDPADNVFRPVPPLTSHRYEYHIPRDQPAGLHWYHPHSHGSTAHQAWQGLAGPMIVEGDIDQVPDIAEMRERTLVINSLWLNADGETPSAVIFPVGGPMPFTTIPAVPTEMLFPINGQLQPDIDIRPGETQRWRVLNAAPHRAMWLHVERHLLHQIGQDGVPFSHPRRVSSILLSPANRAEFVVRGGEPGRYRIYAQAYDQGHPGGARPTVELATLVVAGHRTTGRIPTQLVDPPRMPDLPVARRRRVTFRTDITGTRGLGVRAFIDDQAFDPDRIDQQVELGTVEEWTLVNEDVLQHPIHFHVNPFQVAGVRGIPAGDRTWQTDPTIWWDTFRIPPQGQYTLRTYFRPDIPGKTVFHCHVLPHEDTGMMATLQLGAPHGPPEQRTPVAHRSS